MKEFKFKIITPEQIVFSDDIEQVLVRTTEGDIGVLAGHENYVADLPPGQMRIHQKGNTKIGAIAGGLIRVSKEYTIIMAVAFEWAEDIDIEWAKRSEEDARSRMQQRESDVEFREAKYKLKRALNRISVHGNIN